MNKRHTVRFEKSAQKSLLKMDTNDAKIIMAWISKNLVHCEDPYRQGKSLQGNLREKWRYRVGDYRFIAHIDDETITILVLAIGHRKNIYR